MKNCTCSKPHTRGSCPVHRPLAQDEVSTLRVLPTMHERDVLQPSRWTSAEKALGIVVLLVLLLGILSIVLQVWGHSGR